MDGIEIDAEGRRWKVLGRNRHGKANSLMLLSGTSVGVQREVTSADAHDLAARFHALQLQVRGLRANIDEQTRELAQRERDEANGTAALRRLERTAERLRAGKPDLAAPEAFALACKEDPAAYAEYREKTILHTGAGIGAPRK